MKTIIVMFLLYLNIFAAVKISISDNPPEDTTKYNFMPEKPLALDSLLIIKTDYFKDSAKYSDFKSIAINSGAVKICANDSCNKEKQITIPAGLLISDRTAYELACYRIAMTDVNRRLLIAKEILYHYDKNIKQAQLIYNYQIEDLRQQAKRSWFEQNIKYIAFITGLVTAIATEFAVMRVK